MDPSKPLKDQTEEQSRHKMAIVQDPNAGLLWAELVPDSPETRSHVSILIRGDAREALGVIDTFLQEARKRLTSRIVKPNGGAPQ